MTASVSNFWTKLLQYSSVFKGAKKPEVTWTGRNLAGELRHIFSQLKRNGKLVTCSAARGNSFNPITDVTPTRGYAILSTEIVPSDFTCSVSSLGQSSLHYLPADISLRRFQLAGIYAHSWSERIQILHYCMWDCGKSVGAISALRLALRYTRQVPLAASSLLGYRVPWQTPAVDVCIKGSHRLIPSYWNITLCT